MGKSKWNRGNSIPISSLNDWELMEAIHEWSEGNIHLENLLWNCYNNRVYTGGCDAGEHHFGYVDFYIEDSERSALKRILKGIQKFGGASIFLLMHANPYSGPDWHKAVISVTPAKNKDVNDLFDAISAALLDESDTEIHGGFTVILDFYDFLKEKEAGLDIRMNINHGKYKFLLESFGNKRNWEHFSNLFEMIGFKKDENVKSDAPFMAWGFKCNEESEFTSLALEGLEVIKKNWTLKTPKAITEDMPFNYKARIMRRKFGTTKRGERKLQKWLKQERKKMKKR